MNLAMLGEFVLAVLVTQMDAFNRLLGTTSLKAEEFGRALTPPLALLVLWEIGKLAARHWQSLERPRRSAAPLTESVVQG